LEQRVVPILDIEYAGLEIPLSDGMAGLARAVDVEQRAPNPVVAHLEGADTPVRHVTVRARHAGACVDPLGPHLELRMLGLEHLVASLRMHPVGKALRVVVRLDLLGPEPVGPRIRHDFAVASEVVLAVRDLRRVGTLIAEAVVREARDSGLGRPLADGAIGAAVAAAQWEPRYPRLEPIRAQ
jgi:hypothetical protein